MRNRQGKKRKGFTLVEIIVVLVILAITAAILVPAFVGYIDKANETKAIAETRLCVVSAQALMTENYGANRTIIPAYADILAHAEVGGTLVAGSIQELNAQLTHLSYANYGYTVTYCADPNACGRHAEVYTLSSGGGAAGGSSVQAVVERFPAYNTEMDNLGLSRDNSKVTALFNTLDADVQGFLTDRSWRIYSDGNAIPDAACSSKVRFYFTDALYTASDNATNVAVYKARVNDDGTVSYQKGTCSIRAGKIYPNAAFTAWGDDWSAL